MTDGQILVHVEPGAGGEARLRYALSTAQKLNAKLVGLTVKLSAAAATKALIGEPEALDAVYDASTDSCRDAQGSFERITADSGHSAEWRVVQGVPIEIVVAEAACADFVILGRGDRKKLDGGMYTIPAADVIMAGGSPVIVVPDEAPAFSANRIMVAWKSGPQAIRAIRNALPLLIKADSVLLTEVVQGSAANRVETSAQTMAEYLESHGVRVVVNQTPQASDPGEQLIRTAQLNNCDMIVAGAYGHSRLREWALGGVTQTLLARAPLPCLLSH